MAKIYTIGEMLVEIMRDAVDSPLGVPGSFLGPFPSGAPAIFISTVAQLGHEAQIWGGVGNDKFGRCLLSRLESDGVNCNRVSVVDGRATAVAFVAYDSSGEREFIYHIDGTPATEVRFKPTDEPVPDYFHVMGCSLMASRRFETAINKAVQFYSDNGGKISFDPNIRQELLGERSIWDVAGTVMDQCSIFLPGVSELKLFTESSTIEECISELFDRYSKLEIIHLKNGKLGSVIYTRTESIKVPIYPIEKIREIVDPTGAGDSFDAAFLCGLSDGMNLSDAGAYAAKAGALNSVAFGPMEGDMSEITEDLI